MSREKRSRELRLSRHRRIRNKVSGTSERPRLAVFRSLNHIYSQVIDDTNGVTIVAASSLEPTIRASKKGQQKGLVARMVGERIAQRVLDRGITEVVMDRGGFRYHGRVKALAEAAREGGLHF